MIEFLAGLLIGGLVVYLWRERHVRFWRDRWRKEE